MDEKLRIEPRKKLRGPVSPAAELAASVVELQDDLAVVVHADRRTSASS
jgi:hypothetical protein